jgi:hypothetical protein
MNCTTCGVHIDTDADFYASEEGGDFCEECIDLRAYEGMRDARLYYETPVSVLTSIIDREGL